MALVDYGSFPLFDKGSPFLALFCVSLRLAWLGVRRVLRLPFRFCAIESLCGPQIPPVRILGFMLQFLSLASLAAALGFGEFLVLEEGVCIGRCLGESFFFPHFVRTTGRADVPVLCSFGLLSLHAYAENLGVFLLLSVLCVLSICTCSTFPRWWLDPLCVYASSIALLGNLRERCVVPFESCFLCGLCVLSIHSCGSLPRWCLGPLCVRAYLIALLDNLKECRFTRFEGCFLWWGP